MLQLYGADVRAFLAFARPVVNLRQQFDAIESPVACNRPDDDTLGDHGADLRSGDFHSVLERSSPRVGHCSGQLAFEDL